MSPPATVSWWRDGEAFLGAAVTDLDDESLAGPSGLPGWDRRTLVAHVARNADALTNLLTWARTGVETPMYASPEARAEGIAKTAQLSCADLLADYGAATDRLTAAVDQVPESAWQHQVRTAQGRTVPAAQIPWMRCRETWVHLVDLDTGTRFDDLPAEVLDELVSDVVRTWSDRGESPAVCFTVRGADEPTICGDGPATVSGPLPAVVALMTGRATPSDVARLTGDGIGVSLPRWL